MRPLFLFVAACALLGAGRSPAQTSWISPVGGAWENPAAWSAGLPQPGQITITVTNAGTKTVTLSASTPTPQLALPRVQLSAPGGATNTLHFNRLVARPVTFADSFVIGAGGAAVVEDSALLLDGAGGAALTVEAGSLQLLSGTIDAGGGGVRFGRTGAAEYVQQTGTLLAGTLDIGDLTGHSGTAFMRGGTILASEAFIVGDNPGAVGRLVLEAGTVISTNALYTARIGDDGVGQVDISGGELRLADVSVGRATGSLGTVTVMAGSFVSEDLTLGRFAGGEGRLILSGSGVVDLQQQSLRLGREGTGVASITGGTLLAGEVVLAMSPGANGELNLSGGTLLVVSNILIGVSNTASASLTGGTLQTTSTLSEGWLAVLNGELTLAGARVSVDRFTTSAAGVVSFLDGQLETANSHVTNTVPFVVGDGVRPATLVVRSGTHRFAGGLVVRPGAQLLGWGTIIGPVTNQGLIRANSASGPLRFENAVNNQGVLRVGTVGTLELPGGLNNSGAYVITRPTAPELNFQRVGGAGRLTFLAEAGVDYHVTSRLALPPGSWTAVQTVPGQGSTEQIPFSLTADQRFFRVEVLP